MRNFGLEPTKIEAPDYFHKVVDCQWACPAHTPAPGYIRLIAEGRYTDIYMINGKSSVFPGILGRTCDRPREPACRRGRVEDEPATVRKPLNQLNDRELTPSSAALAAINDSLR
jgi:NADPH-dependent glutamate synthase beta subunit-like oxidoreductase